MTNARLLLLAAAACGLLFFHACAAGPDGNGRLMQADISDLAGRWEGTLSLNDQQLDIVVRFEIREHITGSIDIPQQGSRDLPLANIRLLAGSVYFELPAGTGNALFCGQLERDLITGSFTQSGARGTFRLVRGAASTVPPDPARTLPATPAVFRGEALPRSRNLLDVTVPAAKL
jgi:hypothetical protein